MIFFGYFTCPTVHIIRIIALVKQKSEFQNSDKWETALAAIPALLCRLPPQVWECWARGIRARTRSRARLPRPRSNTHSEISNECIFQPLESIRFNISSLGGAFLWLWHYSLVSCLDSDKWHGFGLLRHYGFIHQFIFRGKSKKAKNGQVVVDNFLVLNGWPQMALQLALIWLLKRHFCLTLDS